MKSRLVGATAVSLLAAVTGCSGAASGVATPLRSAPEPAASPRAAHPAGTSLPLAGTPEGVVITASGVVAIAVRDPAALIVFPLRDPLNRRTVPTPAAARHLALAAANGPVLVPGEADDRLIEVGLPEGQALATIPVGRQPHDAAASGNSVFVGDEFANTVHVVTGGTTKVVPAPLQPGGVAAEPNGSVIVVVGVRGRRITAYRPDGTTIGTSNCGAGPTHVVASDADVFWVADTKGDAVLGFRIGPTGPRLVARIDLGHRSRPYGLAYDRRRSTLWVTLTGTNRLVGLQVHGTDAKPGATFDTVRQPNSVAVDEPSGELVVTGSTPSGSVQFISQ